MSVVDVIDDLLTLQDLAEDEHDEARRDAIVAVQRRVAARDKGAKVSEAATVLGVSAPTVRSWIEAGVLTTVGQAPVRVDLLSVAVAKRVVDELRRHRDDRQLLADVLRVLRDEAALGGPGFDDALDDLRAGRVRRLDRQRLDELLPAQQRSPKRRQRKAKRSTSS